MSLQDKETDKEEKLMEAEIKGHSWIEELGDHHHTLGKGVEGPPLPASEWVWPADTLILDLLLVGL